jgi:hypothetical protein
MYLTLKSKKKGSQWQRNVFVGDDQSHVGIDHLLVTTTVWW